MMRSCTVAAMSTCAHGVVVKKHRLGWVSFIRSSPPSLCPFIISLRGVDRGSRIHALHSAWPPDVKVRPPHYYDTAGRLAVQRIPLAVSGSTTRLFVLRPPNRTGRLASPLIAAVMEHPLPELSNTPSFFADFLFFLHADEYIVCVQSTAASFGCGTCGVPGLRLQQLDSMLPYLPHNPRRLDDEIIQKSWTLHIQYRYCNQDNSAQPVHHYTRPTTTPSSTTNAKTLSHFKFYAENFTHAIRQLEESSQTGSQFQFVVGKPRSRTRLLIFQIMCLGAKRKRLAYPVMHFQPTSFVIGVDPGKRGPDLLAPQSRTPVPLQRSISDPQKIDTGIRWFVRYIEVMLAHYTMVNDHAEWRWRVYRLKQREVEQVCKFIATLSGRRDNLRDSKTDLFVAWRDAPVNWNASPAIQAPRSASRHDRRSVYCAMGR
ncbi:hypothetical protein BJ742DRAFT_856432 [Cladochytrium replicatum]|nr:hypothetical protein BJ742DRAFT_856432 [Cladochytrium replicatum]